MHIKEIAKYLDQVYTKKDVAEFLFLQTKKVIINFSEYILIDPSAGSGAFSDLFCQEFIAIDIDPKKDYISKDNFVSTKFKDKYLKSNNKYITIGSPPFGKKGALAIEFFNQAANFSEYICFILPKSFNDKIITEKFNKIYEVELNPESFIFLEESFSVDCIFQVWKKV